MEIKFEDINWAIKRALKERKLRIGKGKGEILATARIQLLRVLCNGDYPLHNEVTDALLATHDLDFEDAPLRHWKDPADPKETIYEPMPSGDRALARLICTAARKFIVPGSDFETRRVAILHGGLPGSARIVKGATR